MNDSQRNIRSGAPWRYCLSIRKLQKDALDAGTTLVGAKWIWPTVVISAAISLGLDFAGWSAWTQGKIGAAITASSFAILFFAAALFVTGCASYLARLTVDTCSVQFTRRFFWVSREFKHNRSHLQYVQCWSHKTGSGRYRSCSFHVCLHFEPPLPVLCVYSQEYAPDMKRELLGALGLRRGMLSREGALCSVLAKADEIADRLGIEHRANSA